MKHLVLFALLIAAPVLAEQSDRNVNEPRPHSGQLMIASDRTPAEQCIADCAARQVVCTGQCVGNGQCFANCMKERDYCVAQCRSR